jgi:hypothetical protein
MKAVDLQHWRPYVDLAQHPVHASSAGLTSDPGNDGDVLLAGPSNAGLAEVGHSAAISLHLATLALVMRDAGADHLVVLVALNELVNDVGEAFAEGEREYVRRKTRHSRKLSRSRTRTGRRSTRPE